MCEICGQTPCHPRCPNAPEPEPVHICILCSEGIFAGDKFYESDDGPVCEECMRSMSLEEILEMFGESLSEAESE